MPELAEVEVGRKVAERTAVGRRIVRARAEDDDIVLDGVSPTELEAALTGAEVLGVHRHGKHLWFSLDRRPWPLFHFGMTGAFVVPRLAPLPLESGIRHDPAIWPPRFTKLHLGFDDGGELVMTNARRLGRIRLRENPPNEPPLRDLGFDPFHQLPPIAEFRRRLGRRKIPVKALLLDQAFAAGIGNWLADEILYQARLDPRRSVSELEEDEVRRLRDRMRRVVQKAVEVDADKRRFPRSWLFHHRWGKRADARVAGGHRVEHLTVAGRTTAWVPSLQS